MASPLDMASDVVSGGASFAGLILVYLGAIAAGYDSYETTQKHAVRSDYRKRGWVGCIGILISLAAAGFGLVGKWLSDGQVVAGLPYC